MKNNVDPGLPKKTIKIRPVISKEPEAITSSWVLCRYFSILCNSTSKKHYFFLHVCDCSGLIILLRTEAEKSVGFFC